MKQKLERAIAYLGPKYICHPSQRVARLTQGQQADIHKADVAATIKRVRKAMEKENTNA